MNHEAISDEMLLSYLLGELAAYERLHVEQWLDASPDHRLRFEDMESLWMKTALPDTIPGEWDVEKAWGRVSQRIDNAARSEQRKKTLIRRFLWMAVPAAALLAVVFVIRSVVNPVQETIFLNAEAGRLTDTLPDGSVVMLAPGSRLWYEPDMNESGRRVNLSGEAFFAVTHDSVHPFSVSTMLGSVKVLGTRFIVRTPGDTSLYVSVGEGLVQLSHGEDAAMNTAVRLGAGAAGIITRARPEPRPAAPARADEFYSYTGIVAFNDEPLTSVASTFSLTHGIVLRFGTPAIGQMRLTATFSKQPPDEIVAVVAATLGLSVEPLGNRIYILKPAAGE